MATTSINIYTVDATTAVTKQFAVNFTLGFLSRDHVTAFVEDELDGGGNQIFRTITWINDGLITLSGTLAIGDVVKIQRTTPAESLIHDFQAGAVLREGNLDEAHLQALMILHEVFDGRNINSFSSDLNMNQFDILNINATHTDQLFINGVEVVSGETFTAVGVRPVVSVADLRSLPSVGTSAITLGYTSAGDGGGATYYLDATDTTSADDGYLTIVASDGGRWKIVKDGVPLSRALTTDIITSVNYAGAPAGTIIETLGYTTKGDGGGAQWKKTGVTGLTPSQSPADLVKGKLTDANGHEWELAATNYIDARVLGGAPDGIVDNTLIIAAALAYLAASGGTIYLARGVWLVSNSNPGATSWDNNVAIWVLSDNISIRGEGAKATVIKLATGGDSHVIKFGQRVNGSVTVSGGGVYDLSIDGNRLNQTATTETTNHWSGIDIASGCDGITIRDAHVSQTVYYGIAGQRDDISNCTIENVVIDSTGGDGVDWKNDSGTGTGNVINNIRVSNHGLALLSSPQAGIDVRSGVYVNNIVVSSMDAASDNVGVRTQGDGDATSTAIATQPPHIRNVTVNGADSGSTVGVRIGTRNTTLENAVIQNCSDGIRVSRPDVRISACSSISNAVGIRLQADVTAALEADTCSIVMCTIRDNTGDGIVYSSVDEISVSDTDVRNNGGNGHNILSGSTNIRIRGGSCTNNLTDISDNGTGTSIRNVSGIKTESSLITSSPIAIDSTGTKSFSIAHGLSFTPDIRNISLTLKRNTNVGDWSAGFLWVTSTDATNINGQLRVLTASATGGAVVDVVSTVHEKAF